MSKEGEHQAVLLAEVLAALALTSGQNVLDATIGRAGHANAILQATAPSGHLLGLDADPVNAQAAQKALGAQADRVRIVNCSFRNLTEEVRAAGEFITPLDAILFDLGFASTQLTDPERGLSFQVEAPLDMRLSGPKKGEKPFAARHDHYTLQELRKLRATALSAYDLVNYLEVRELTTILRQNGEEWNAPRISKAIVAARQTPIATTTQLATLIEGVSHRRGKIHPATKTFQALRITVNDELATLQDALPQALAALKPGGRLAVISFHSLEDRIVKKFFRSEAVDCICPPQQPLCTCDHKASLTVLTKKPITPTLKEIHNNPRSRSAKLRVAEKL